MDHMVINFSNNRNSGVQTSVIYHGNKLFIQSLCTTFYSLCSKTTYFGNVHTDMINQLLM